MIEQIKNYFETQPVKKKWELEQLHECILKITPHLKLWFFDGKDHNGKVISNPNVGYGIYTINYANGSKRDFYRIGLSANTSGISVYIMGISDKKYLSNSFLHKIGKASISSYCIKFKSLEDIHLNVLLHAIQDGLNISGNKDSFSQV